MTTTFAGIISCIVELLIQVFLSLIQVHFKVITFQVERENFPNLYAVTGFLIITGYIA